jgi:hypothetical protein
LRISNASLGNGDGSKGQRKQRIWMLTPIAMQKKNAFGAAEKSIPVTV